MNQTIEPIDKFVLSGFSDQISANFKCPCVYVTGPDKVPTLARVLGDVPKYPYMFFSILSWGSNTDSYLSTKTAREGLQITAANTRNQAQMVHVLPAKFEIELTYVTNKHDGSDTTALLGFARKWLLLRRVGALSFVVNYGLTQFPIHCILSDTVPFAPKESPTEGEAVYQAVVQATINGYISEPVTTTDGIVSEVAFTPPDADPKLPGQFFPF